VRAFLLLKNAQLITLKETSSGMPTVESNPKNLQFKEMDAAQLPRVLPDVAAAVINTTYALPAGLHPAQDALLTESKDSPYANIVVIRKDTTKKAQLELFVKALNSAQVKEKAKELFGDAAIAAW
jgi:D-methionine transport system substrate-binding protein